MDTFVTLVFTVVAVLFTALGVVAMKGSDEPSLWGSPVIAAVALYFALRSYFVRSHSSDSEPRKWYDLVRPLELIIGTVIVGASMWQTHVSAEAVQQAKDKATQAIESLNQEKQLRETEIRELRQQLDAKADSLQQQFRLLQQSQPKAK